MRGWEPQLGLLLQVACLPLRAQVVVQVRVRGRVLLAHVWDGKQVALHWRWSGSGAALTSTHPHRSQQLNGIWVGELP